MPDSAPPAPSPRSLPGWVAALVFAVALLAAGWATQRQAETVFLDDAAQTGRTTLRLATATLRAQLERYERLPALIAEQDLVIRLAQTPRDQTLVNRANRMLRDLALHLRASDIYFMDVHGTTRAASNFDTGTSFMGRNFAFRPYFADALAGGEGRFFALGTTSLKRGYYFGAPVTGGDGILGVLVFKIDLDEIESTWRGGPDEIIVTDPEGVVFLSSREDWLFRALTPLEGDRLDRTRTTRRYADRDIGVLPLQARDDLGGRRYVSMEENGDTRGFLKLTEPMPEADWDVSVLLATAPAERQARTAALVVVLVLALGSLALWTLAQRRARLADRLQMQQAVRDQLEARVVERTAELAAVNVRLEAEVAERTAAEAELRRAQAGLVQAGKMAALGQMSAALSHEFNQPLAAARNYADNALVLFDRGRTADARSNIERILALIDRMTAISRTLRSFARKPGESLGPVDLAETVAAAMEIAELRLKSAGAVLDVTLAPGLPRVTAGPVRLQQVLVNLVTNAADAVQPLADRRIGLAAIRTPGGVRITVRDHGPGVPEALRERIFDPFFSTKEVGKGLGLGLSISYNIVKDFGGHLSVADAPGGGALFVLDLRAAEAGQSAA